MKKFKSIILIIIMITVLLSYCPFSFATVTDSDNGKMYYYQQFGKFDIKGYVNGKLQSTTYTDNGYDTFLKVGNNETKTLRFSE